jgi:hypothetical protein
LTKAEISGPTGSNLPGTVACKSCQRIPIGRGAWPWWPRSGWKDVLGERGGDAKRLACAARTAGESQSLRDGTWRFEKGLSNSWFAKRCRQEGGQGSLGVRRYGDSKSIRTFDSARSVWGSFTSTTDYRRLASADFQRLCEFNSTLTPYQS